MLRHTSGSGESFPVPGIDRLGAKPKRSATFNGRRLDNEQDPWFDFKMPEGVKDITAEEALANNRKLRCEQFERDYKEAHEKMRDGRLDSFSRLQPLDFVHKLPDGYFEEKLKNLTI